MALFLRLLFCSPTSSLSSPRYKDVGAWYDLFGKLETGDSREGCLLDKASNARCLPGFMTSGAATSPELSVAFIRIFGEEFDGVVIGVDVSEPLSIDKVEADDVEGEREKVETSVDREAVEAVDPRCEEAVAFSGAFSGGSWISGGRNVVETDEAAELCTSLG